MSFRVVAKVLRHSEQRLARRLILIVLAEVAHDDGVAYLSQDEIARRARLSRTHTVEELRGMTDDSVIETRKAKRGRRRVNVYRIVEVPGLDDVDYDRLPFILDTPFTTSELPTPSPADDVGSTASTTSDLPGLRDPSPLKDPSFYPSVGLATNGARELVAGYVDASRERGSDPPERVVGQMARQIAKLLAEGVAPAAVKAGIDRMLDLRRVRPDMLANFVAEAQLAPPDRRREGPGGGPTPEEMLSRAAEMRERGE